MTDNKLHSIYYRPEGYYKTAKQLREALPLEKNKPSLKEIQDWLDKQPMHQIYKPKPKHIRVPRFMVKKPNDVHQADLLFLPHDKAYKYTLSIVDVASRYKAAVPLQTKNTGEVAKAFKSVYDNKNNPLTYPNLLQVDEGTEFKGLVKQLMENHDVTFRRGEPGNHKAQAVVESFNKALAKQIFLGQYQEELQTNERSRKWVKELPAIVRRLNNQKTAMIKMEPAKAIKLNTVNITTSRYKNLPVAPEEELVDIDSIVRYLYAPGELEGGDRRRATDPIWSIHPFEIDRIIEIESQPVLYFLRAYKGHTPPRRSFVKEELQVVPDSEAVVPDSAEAAKPLAVSGK